MRDDRQGCLSGLLKLFLVKKGYDWSQRTFGFGNGCFGVGCGCLLMIIFVFVVLGILFDTNFFRFSF